jgi:2-keto-myo-inositol isomerase
MDTLVSRRAILAGLGSAALALPAAAAEPPKRSRTEPFGYSFNTSTIRGQKVPLPDEVDMAARAGYHAIEPWIREIDDYVTGGGSLKDLRKRIEDRGLTMESAIGFPEWIVDDDARRARGLEEAKRGMDLVAQLGGKRLAAPPVGATDRSDLDSMKIAERYHALLEVGDQMGVVPQLEVWGFSKTLNRLGTGALAAIESAHPKACVLADVYHLYKGGSDFTGVKLLSGAAMQVFHVNDYPAIERGVIKDANRVYPGDGIAPLDQLFRDLYACGFRGHVSLELFNPDYYKLDPYEVVSTGLAKTRAAVRKAFEKDA